MKKPNQVFSLRETADIVGLRLPTLSYWVNTGLIQPKETTGEGKGRRHRLSVMNLLEVLLVERLRKRGLSMQRLRRAVEALESQIGERYFGAPQSVTHPLARLTLITDGQELFQVVESDEELARVVKLYGGPGLFAVVLDELWDKASPYVEVSITTTISV